MIDLTQTPLRCGAKTRSGVACAKFPMDGKRRCRLHGGLSTGPKTPAGRAAIPAANTKHGRYKNWREKRAKEEHYRGEINRVMKEGREGGPVAALRLFLAADVGCPPDNAGSPPKGPMRGKHQETQLCSV